MEREPITKKTRFEIFKRDSFTCQYCGKSAPDIILELDHIMPVVKGGSSDITNLITSCHACNSGKSDRELSDDAVIQKRKKQLDELNERREQLEMMMEWHEWLMSIESDSVNYVVEFWNKTAGTNFIMNEKGVALIKDWVRKFGMMEVIESIKICEAQYLRNENSEITPETVTSALSYIPKVCKMRKTFKLKPYMKELFYIRGIINKRFYPKHDTIILLEKAYNCGADLETLRQFATEANSYRSWREIMELAISEDK
jgi:hypothetical protein